MTPAFQVLLCLCLLGLSYAAPQGRNMRWCVTSDDEEKKCNDVAKTCTVNDIHLICVKRSCTEDCQKAISNGEADAISLDSEHIYESSLNPLNLKPIMTESYHYHRDLHLADQSPCQKERRHQISGGPLRGGFMPECDEWGNYGPHQFHGSTGYSWCVNKDGEEIDGTKTPPGQPHHTCEDQKSTRCLRHRHSVLGGKKPKVGAFAPECDEKGEYVPSQCHGAGNCWCVYKTGEEVPGTRTAPHTVREKCEVIEKETPCLKERQKVLRVGHPILGAFVPQCDEKGNYSPKQCHGSTGYCWCVNDEGQEIAGTKTPPGKTSPTCGDQHIETPCLKERQKVLSAGHPEIGAFMPDCDKNGYYRPKQCHGSTGYCWCVTKDGEEIQGTKTAPGQSPPRCEVTDSETCHYAVAVVKKSSTLQFDQLKGKRSCHSAVGATAGWTMPLYALIKNNLLVWEGPEEKSLEKAAKEFFSSSCAPGAKEENLCKQCAGQEHKCERGPGEPYYGDEGALRCLRDNKGDVAFMEDTVLSEEHMDSFELLCPDNTRRELSQYKTCNFGKVPRHAVVTRISGEKDKDITEYLLGAQSKECGLFSSSHGHDLMFEDTTIRFIALPSEMDTFLFLGPELYNAMKTLHGEHPPSHNEVRWCTLNRNEKLKCDDWSAVSGGAIKCTEPSSPEECIQKVLKREADVVTLNEEHMYEALKCGLVPAFEEYYNKDHLAPCTTPGAQFTDVGEPMALAVVKKSDTDITLNNLKGKKSCHTGVGHMAGWVIPVSLISKQTKNCDLGSFFSESCAPGSAIDSNLCKLCIGDPENANAGTKCSPSDKEAYYGNEGAIRCLVETGDVAFVTHNAIFENTDGNNPALWAKDLKSTDLELLCRDGSRASVTDYKKCKFAGLHVNGIFCHVDNFVNVVRIILHQQTLFGRDGSQKDMFQMFESSHGQDLLMKDATQCLIDFDRVEKLPVDQDYFGQLLYNLVYKENRCFPPSALASACTFHHC